MVSYKNWSCVPLDGFHGIFISNNFIYSDLKRKFTRINVRDDDLIWKKTVERKYNQRESWNMWVHGYSKKLHPSGDWGNNNKLMQKFPENYVKYILNAANGLYKSPLILWCLKEGKCEIYSKTREKPCFTSKLFILIKIQ